MKKVLALLENNFQDHEFSGPLLALNKAGIQTVVASHQKDQHLTGKQSSRVVSQLSYDEVDPKEFAALFIPGGGSPANVRKFPKAIEIARAFAEVQKPIAAICHGPQVLVTAGLLKNKTVTCWPDVAKEIKTAGAIYVDEEVVVDGNLITSRNPHDVPAFASELLKTLT